MTMLSVASVLMPHVGLAAQETEHGGGVPPEVIGLGTFLFLVLLLAITLLFGKGRPHA